jgi:hypothetical protein
MLHNLWFILHKMLCISCYFLVHKIFTFYINGVLKFNVQLQGQRIKEGCKSCVKKITNVSTDYSAKTMQ